ncbi:MAG TPA: ATP-binding protein [Verrucomicrobiae bacterium]|nr:ATP-binding protein [Verrucomicrobiae bacterium]
MINRYLIPKIRKSLDEGNVAIIYGARQTGKTTIAQQLLTEHDKGLYLNCDEPDIRERLTNRTSTELKALFGDASFVVLDEAQRIKDIGLTAKLIHDTYPEIKLLLTGSSSIDLANTVKEPLTGRSEEYILYPLATIEVADSPIEATRLIEKSLLLGAYPKAWSMSHNDAAAYLRKLVNDFLYRDAFGATVTYDNTIFDNLLRLLAFQVGNEMSYSEVGSHLGINKETAMRYIDLLEKAFIVFRLPQYRKNQRNEVGKLRKVYFYDLGVRNGLIDNFQPLAYRNDVGALWENYCIIERKKYLQRADTYARQYYWRSDTKQEIDLVEEIGTETAAYEFKYKEQQVKKPSVFGTEYPDVPFHVVSRGQISGFLY